MTQKFYAGQESILYILAKPELYFQVETPKMQLYSAPFQPPIEYVNGQCGKITIEPSKTPEIINLVSWNDVQLNSGGDMMDFRIFSTDGSSVGKRTLVIQVKPEIS